MLPGIQIKMDKLVVAGRSGCRQNNMSQRVLRVTGYDVSGKSITDCFTVPSFNHALFLAAHLL